MSETIISKRCSKCKELKQISEFYKAPRNKDGHKSECKICWLKYVKEYRQTVYGKATQKRYQQSNKGKLANKRYHQTEKSKAKQKRYYKSKKGKLAKKHFRISHPKQIKAENAVNYAVTVGKLSRPNTLLCHYCSKQAQQYHHWHGYEKEHWLDVITVCIPCHIKQHSSLSYCLNNPVPPAAIPPNKLPPKPSN